jgi:hypothetical protein
MLLTEYKWSKPLHPCFANSLPVNRPKYIRKMRRLLIGVLALQFSK